jgi:hypothetical protein
MAPQNFLSSDHVIDHVHGLVTWIPLVDVNQERGSVEICLSSHDKCNVNEVEIAKRGGNSNSSEYLFLLPIQCYIL